MENEIVSPDDGVVASVEVSAGANVEAGALLASIN
ncbi:MAG: acetyl-CoA carboxylase biotin carboxyl carrier protein subunit, partial [Lachnospiraceae bacterium]|nr:acetyl-CoA carboxylase biotin carboxyl carrier protein subunit [Lachnospiraceae bacterium]